MQIWTRSHTVTKAVDKKKSEMKNIRSKYSREREREREREIKKRGTVRAHMSVRM